MRIIAGSRRGMLLSMHKGMTTRPTGDRVREAVFSSLQDRLSGTRFLDLFAGSGAIGLEALSRGARECVFVDRDRQALKTLKKNIGTTDFGHQSRVLGMDFHQALRTLAPEAPFDLVYIDPPYTKEYYAESLTLIEKYDIISDNGILVCESGKGPSLKDAVPAGFVVLKEKYYGDTTVTYLRKRP